MVKGGLQNLPADVSQLIDQLERLCLAPDGSLVSKSAFYDLQLARDEMSRERLRYLEAMAIYSEAIAMVEENHQAFSVGGIRCMQGFYPQFSMKNPQVYETLEHQLVVAEAAQILRLPLILKDGEIHEEEIEKWSVVSRSSLDSTSTNFTFSTTSATNNALSVGNSDSEESRVGGVSNCFLGITLAYLWQTQLQKMPLRMEMAQYQMSPFNEIETRLKDKCDKLSDAFDDDVDSSSASRNSFTRLPERVNLIIEEIEWEEAALQKDLYSADRKFAEYFSVLEQILAALSKLEKDLKLLRQYKFDELQKTCLCKRCEAINSKLREHLVKVTEEASTKYNKEMTRLREYQGLGPHFDTNCKTVHHEIMKKLEETQDLIHQVETDLQRMPDHPTS